MKGYYHQQKVSFDPLPCFEFSAGGILVEKKICLIYGENTVAVSYRIINGTGKPARIRLTPLVNYRDHHHNSKRAYMQFEKKTSDPAAIWAHADNGPTAGNSAVSAVEIIPYGLDNTIKIGCRGGTYTDATAGWFENMFYNIEEERGLEAYEDHYIPGSFDVEAGPYSEKTVAIICTIEKERVFGDISAIIKAEEQRILELPKTAGLDGDDFASKLVKAADNFLVYRKSTDAKSIIAGYPWFSDWGRDAMISVCGLTLVTGRYDDAEEILYTFSRYVRYGLVPNMFPEGGEEPLYNSVDAALWYFEAIGKYIRYTGRRDFVRDRLYASMKAIISNFRNGTIYRIGMDSDGLISAGDKDLQLTWMDAKVGSWVVTPRHGKAVEINALWYNALRVMEELAPYCGDDPAAYSADAERAKASFGKLFWNSGERCLYDVIFGENRDGSIRPNQIFAASLLYPVLEGEMAKAVVDKVWKELYTPVGLRTLSKDSPAYRGIYISNQFERDGAYHQGTVWAWLTGHFITAFVRVYGKDGKYGRLVSCFFDPFRDHLRDACIDSISEIFDGDAPHYPRGCGAQAWSVAEILRSYIEDFKSL